MHQSIFKSLTLLILLIASTISSANHHKIRHHHKHRHKQILTIDSNELNEIREAFDDYRKSVQYKHKISEEAMPKHHEQIFNTLTDEEETVPAQSYHHNSNAMLRHKRVHTTTRMTTTTASSNDDDYYEDGDNDTNRRVNDDSRGSQPTQGETLTQYKNANLGTREGVDRSFQQHKQNQVKTLVQLYRENYFRTKQDGLCRWPSKKAVQMPHLASINYSPSKYIVYQCSDDTSCCSSPDKTCVAKNFTEIQLWFYVTYSNRTTGYKSISVKNHTECHCIDKIQLTTPIPSQFRPQRTTISSPCRCPADFRPLMVHGSCECKCEQQNCRMRAMGEEKFSMSDRRSINRGDFGTIKCNIGHFNKSHGQCSNRNERAKRNFSHHHFLS